MGKNERAILEAAVDLMDRDGILDAAGMLAGRLARDIGKYLEETEMGAEAPENPEVMLPEIRELAESMNLMTKLMTMVLGSDEEYEQRELAGLDMAMGEAVAGKAELESSQRKTAAVERMAERSRVHRERWQQDVAEWEKDDARSRWHRSMWDSINNDSDPETERLWEESWKTEWVKQYREDLERAERNLVWAQNDLEWAQQEVLMAHEDVLFMQRNVDEARARLRRAEEEIGE